MYILHNDDHIDILNYNYNSDMATFIISKDYGVDKIYNTFNDLISNNNNIVIYDDFDTSLITLDIFNTIETFTFQSLLGYCTITLVKYGISALRNQITQCLDSNSVSEGKINEISNQIISIEDDVDTVKSLVDQSDKENKLLVSISKISAQSFSDEEALSIKNIYETFEDLCAISYKAKSSGYKFIYNNELYKTVQENFTFQSQWIPGIGTSSIYVHIPDPISGNDETLGTLENPIQVPNDVIENAFLYVVGKYYIWKETIYKCEREGDPDGTEYNLTYDPASLVGQYFTLIQ